MNFLDYLFLLLALVDVPLGKAIINGSPATSDKFKYVVLLEVTAENLIGRCTGAIIGELHVLTAAHCLESISEPGIIVKAGIKSLLRDAGEIRGVTKIHRHPKYYPGVDDPVLSEQIVYSSLFKEGPRPEETIQTANDIAILTLDNPLPLNDKIAKVDISRSATLPNCKVQCEFAGFGENDEYDTPITWMQWTELIVLPPTECEMQHNSWHRENEFCATDSFARTIPAKGDSGGALVCNGLAIGVLSSGCANPDDASIFSKISSHLDFIDGVINEKSSGATTV